jgi:hypothetical protein
MAIRISTLNCRKTIVLRSLFGRASFFSRNAMKCAIAFRNATKYASDGWPPEMKSITKEASDGQLGLQGQHIELSTNHRFTIPVWYSLSVKFVRESLH